MAENLKSKIESDFRESQSYLSEWRKRAVESYDFVAGRQWPADEMADLQEQNRPVVTFNRILPYLNAVLGMEIANRLETRVLPREPTEQDTIQAEFGTALIKWIRDQAAADDEDHDAFADCVTTGLGCTERHVYLDQDGETVIDIDRVSPFEVGYDPAASKKNLSDARYVWRYRDLSRDEFRSYFPDADLPAKGNDWLGSDYTGESYRSSPHESYEGSGQPERPHRGIRVLEYQWYELRHYRRYPRTDTIDYDNTPVEHDEDDFERDKETLDAYGVSAPRLNRRVYKRAFVSSEHVVLVEDSPCQSGWTYDFLTGWRDGATGYFFGLVESMKDPARWANKFFSQNLEMLQTAGGGGVMYEEGTFVNVNDVEEDWSSNRHIAVRPGRLGSVKAKREVQFPPQIGEMLNFAVRSIEEVTGISKEMLGMVPREQSGVVETSRKRAAYAMLSPLMDSIRRYHRIQGKALLEMANRYIEPGRWIRIGSEFGPEGYARFQPLALKYDLIVDEAPTSPNVKETVWVQLTQMLPMLVSAGVPMPPDLLDYTPLPAPLVMKWKKYIEEQSQPGPEAQIAQRKEMAGIAKTEAQAEQARASAALDMVKAAAEQGAIDAGVARQMAEAVIKNRNLDVQQQSIAHQENKSNLDYDAKMLGILRDLAKMESEKQQNNRPTYQ